MKIKQTKKAHLARFGTRAFAFITDLFMIGMPISLIIMILFGYGETQSDTALDVIVQDSESLKHTPNPFASLTQLILTTIAYIFMWYKWGQTPGKKMLHIKVVDDQTLQTASLLQVILRFFGYFLSVISMVGFFVPLFRKDKKALHDIISKTIVIYT